MSSNFALQTEIICAQLNAAISQAIAQHSALNDRLGDDVARAHGAVVAREVGLGDGGSAWRHLLVAVTDHGRDVIHHVAGRHVPSRFPLLEGRALVARAAGSRDGDGRAVLALLVRGDGLGSHGAGRGDAHEVVGDPSSS